MTLSYRTICAIQDHNHKCNPQTSQSLPPPVFSKVSARRRIPVANTVIVSVLIALLAGLVPLAELANATSIGTLFAFVLVSIGVLVLRRTRPDLPRSFRTPAAPLVALLSVVMCVYLMLNLTGETWVRFLVWLVIGFVIYFAYSRSHSRLQAGAGLSASVVPTMSDLR